MTSRWGRPSLRRRLLLSMLLPAAALAVALGAGGHLLIHAVVQATHDRLLDGSVIAIADRLSVEDGEVTVDLPPVALSMLESQAQDSIYYSVTYDGALVTGYRELPLADPAQLAPNKAYHWDASLRDTAVRVASLARPIYGKPVPVLVQVAETVNARSQVKTRMLAGLAVLETSLLGVVGLLTWLSIGRGLAPLTRLGREIAGRAGPGLPDLKPLDTSIVPVEAVAPVEAFNALLARLEQSLSAIRRFTGDASHQLRNPLAVLRIHLELVRRHGSTTPAGQSALDDIEGAIRRLERMLAQLLLLARADDEGVANGLRLCAFDLASSMAEVVSERVPQALAAGMEVEFERPDQPVMILANEIAVDEIAANLLDNAIRYNRAGGKVTVRVLAGGGLPTLEINDEGPGIPEADRVRVFERFYRGLSQGDLQGSGLGLAIVQALADRIGARVRLGAAVRGSGLVAAVEFQPAPPYGKCLDMPASAPFADWA